MKISYDDITESCNQMAKTIQDKFSQSPAVDIRRDSLSYLGVKIEDNGCKWILTFRLNFCTKIKKAQNQSSQCVEERTSLYTITIYLLADGSVKSQVDSTSGDDLIESFKELISMYFSKCSQCK